MKKTEYISPKLEVVELKYETSLLNAVSDGSGSTTPSTDDTEDL